MIEYASETPAPRREIVHDGRTYNVPLRCQRVWDCLTGQMAAPPAALLPGPWTGAWRVKDIIWTTGHHCDERKLRELVALNPTGFDVREHRSHSGNTYNTYALAAPQRKPDPMLWSGDQGQLFIYMETRI